MIRIISLFLPPFIFHSLSLSPPRFVNSLNRKGLSYSLELNHLSDFSDDEMKSMRGYRHTKDAPRGEVYISRTAPSDVPTSMNWWLKGITSV